MQEFVNEYDYTEELAAESITAWWKWKTGKSKVLLYAIIILSAAFVIFQQEMLFLIPVAVAAASLLIVRFRVRTGIKTEKERLQVLNAGKPLHMKIEIKDKLYMTSKDQSRTIELANVVAYKETEHMYVLFLKGSLTLACKKEGFTLGTDEEFLQFLSQLVVK